MVVTAAAAAVVAVVFIPSDAQLSNVRPGSTQALGHEYRASHVTKVIPGRIERPGDLNAPQTQAV